MEAQEVLYTALDNIPDEIDINIKWDENALTEPEGKLRLTFKNQGIGFNAEIKKELREHQLPILEAAAKKKTTLHSGCSLPSSKNQNRITQKKHCLSGNKRQYFHKL
jgi:hypothetical protein